MSMHEKHIASFEISAKEALKRINSLNLDKVLFLVDKKIGSVEV